MVRQSTAPARQPYETVAPTAVLQALFAGCTCSVVDDWLDDDPIAFLVILDVVRNLLDNAAELVSKRERNGFPCNWMWCGRTEVWAAEVFVQIYNNQMLASRCLEWFATLTTTTDPHPSWFDLDLPSLYLRDWDLFVPQIVLSVESDRVHVSGRHLELRLGFGQPLFQTENSSRLKRCRACAGS